MDIKTEKENFSQYFKSRESFTTDEAYYFFSKSNPEVKRPTVNWRIHNMIHKGIVKRLGRGVYALGREKNFFMGHLQKQKNISFIIKKQFPLIKLCCWHSTAIMEFYQHVAMHDFLLVEVEKDAVDSVYYFLKETNKNTFKEPPKEIIEDFVFDCSDAIIVKALISEAPIIPFGSTYIPTLEKILVDLYADTETFFFLQGQELLNIFNNAFEKYTVNRHKLLRYAKRRNIQNEIQKLINQSNGNKQK